MHEEISTSVSALIPLIPKYMQSEKEVRIKIKEENK